MAFAVLAASLLAACREPAPAPVEPPKLSFLDASLDPELADQDGDERQTVDPIDSARAALRRPADAHAQLRGNRIVVSGPLEVVPHAQFPEPATRRRLDAVAELMHARSDILLLRIDAFSSHDPGHRAARARREIDESQLRADAVLRYLWRERGVSAERLEAVGHGYRPSFAAVEERWPIVLRVAQWAKR